MEYMHKQTEHNMHTQIMPRLLRMRLWHLLLISVVASEILAGILVGIMSIIFRGRVTYDYLITGAVTSLIVATLVVSVILFFVKQLRKTQEALRESEEKYKSLTNNLNVGVYRNTPEPKGKFIEVNPAIMKMFGYDSKEEYLEVNVSDLYQNPDDRKEYDEKILRDGFVKNEELQLQKKTGFRLLVQYLP